MAIVLPSGKLLKDATVDLVKLESDVQTKINKIDTNESNISALDTRVTVNESAIASLQALNTYQGAYADEAALLAAVANDEGSYSASDSFFVLDTKIFYIVAPTTAGTETDMVTPAGWTTNSLIKGSGNLDDLQADISSIDARVIAVEAASYKAVSDYVEVTYDTPVIGANKWIAPAGFSSSSAGRAIFMRGYGQLIIGADSTFADGSEAYDRGDDTFLLEPTLQALYDADTTIKVLVRTQANV